jgi:glycolate oxidase
MIERLKAIGIEAVERAGRVVALPASTNDVSELVRHAREARWIVAPYWLAEGGLGRAVFHLSLERMSAVREVAAADFLAVADGGAVCSALDACLAEHALFWPGSLVAGPDEALSDVIARAPGNWALAGNLLRRHVLGLEVVLADGSLLATGSRTVKCVTGYDLGQMFVGSWGTLGIVTGLTLRLEPLANRESVRERYRRGFAGMEGGMPVARGAGSSDGGPIILARLKRELDPGGVLPPIGVIGTAGAVATPPRDAGGGST